MKLDFNLLRQMEYPQVILCRRSHQKIGELVGVSDLRLDLNLSSWNELSFSVPYRYQGQVHPLWNRIRDLATVFLPQFGYFQIEVSEQDDGANKTKRVTGKSQEAELGQILLHGVQINVVDGDIKDEDFAPKRFYQPLDPEHSILHLLLKEAPHWSIGHVDESLADKQRSFEIDGTSVYDELMGEISEQFHCIFQFDSFRRLIHVYDQNTFGAETTLFLSHDNFIDSFTIEANAGEIKNCFKVSGGSGIDIREVNPNGTAYLYVWGAQDLDDMTPELRKRLVAYNSLYDSQKQPYEALMLQIGQKIEELLALSSAAPADLTSEDWSSYSLNYLEEKRKSNQNALDVAIQKGCGSVNDPNYTTLYLPIYQRLVAIKAELQVRQAQIDAKRAEYNALLAQKQAIQQRLDLERFLGTELWKELSSYRREQTYDNPNYEVTDDMSDIERFALERQLYEQAYEEIQKINDPIYQFSTKMANLYAIFEAQEALVDQFQLGNFIRVGNQEDEVHKVRFLKLSICFEQPEDITVEFGEQMELQDNAAAANRFMDGVRQAASSYSFIRKQIEQDKNAMNYVKAVRLLGLSSALADVHNADNQEFTIGSRGLIGKEWNEEKGDYELEQLHAIHNKLVFTDDGWKSCKLALGKIQINGADVYGLIGDVVIGKVIIGENLYIGNSQNTMLFDKTGLRITNGVNTVTIQPDTNHVFQILKGNTPVMFADAEGNLTLTSRIITDSGYIGGWTIDKNGLRGDGVISGGSINGAIITSNGAYGSTTINGGQIHSIAGTNSVTICGSNIKQDGTNASFINRCRYTIYNDDGQTNESGEVQIKDGTVLIQSSYNAYLRAKTDHYSGYIKLIGISSLGNLVIGQQTGKNGYVHGDTALDTGTLKATPVILYCTTFRVNRDGAFHTNIDSGNLGSSANLIHTKNLTASTGSGANGEYLNIGGKAIPTGDWVASYVSGHLSSIQSQIAGLQAQISALASRPVAPTPST